mgnify:CR=1 FL=1
MIQATQEQQDIIQYARRGESFKILAYAGSGKTSTLQWIAKDKSKQKGLYVAFNKAMASDARAKFPSQVKCSTFHALALSAMPNTIRERLKLPKIQAKMVAELLNLSAMEVPHQKGGKIHLKPNRIGTYVLDSINQFCQTAATQLQPRHVVYPRFLDPDDIDVFQAELFAAVEQLWQELIDPQSVLGIPHPVYLKLWALQKPRLHYDYIMFDEAQDADPVMLDIMLHQQHLQVIYVGDAHQQIYEWRGAINAMKKLPLPEKRLTQSFRFGNEIAAIANIFLKKLGEQSALVGNPALTHAYNPPDEPHYDAVLCRSNKDVMGCLFEAIEQQHKVTVQADLNDLKWFITGLSDIQRGRRSDHPELILFAAWDEVLEFVDSQQGASYKSVVDLLEDYPATRLIALLDEAAKVSPDEADYVISTIHKAKGLEWDDVKLHSDGYRYRCAVPKRREGAVLLNAIKKIKWLNLSPAFKQQCNVSGMNFEKCNKWMVNDAEIRLAYVAVTRAKRHLDYERLQPLIKIVKEIITETARIEQQRTQLLGH